MENDPDKFYLVLFSAMHDGPFYIMILIVLAVSSYYLFFRKKARVHAAISNTPAKKISDVQEDESVSTIGKVVYLSKTMLDHISKQFSIRFSAHTLRLKSNRHKP